MKENDGMLALGLMSGTSLDGIDAALIRTDGESVFEFGPWLTLPYDDAFRSKLRDATYGRGDMPAVEHETTLKHSEAVEALLRQANIGRKEVDVIGFHGQSVAHRPQEGITWQLGNGALLAERTGIDVICDFRRRDVATGGQGAPMVPLYHAALARRLDLPVAVLNIGGSANVTWIGRSKSSGDGLIDCNILAFDTGPGNVMLNEWALAKTGKDCDVDGKLALAGKADEAIVGALLNDSYFTKEPPKSLDRNYFTLDKLQQLSKEDGAATLTEFAAAAVEIGAANFPRPAKQWFISGGGRHNPAFMLALGQRFSQVSQVESLGWIGDALEAQAFAFLAVRSLKGLALSLPTTTGASRAVSGGAHYKR